MGFKYYFKTYEIKIKKKIKYTVISLTYDVSIICFKHLKPGKNYRYVALSFQRAYAGDIFNVLINQIQIGYVN